MAGLVVLLALIGVGASTVQWAKEFQALATAAKADARAGLRTLDKGDPTAALAAFEGAEQQFRAARDRLGPLWLRGAPWLGRQLDAADDLTTIGIEGSLAGAEAARLVATATTVTGQDRLGQLLVAARPHLEGALASLVIVSERADRLDPDGLAEPLAEAVTDLRRELEPLELVLRRSPHLLELVRYLFSGQHRFLLVSQNSSELRPTGGFMGTYGLIQFGPEGFRLESYADIYTLPLDVLDLPIPEGGQPSYRRFTFRNANWWVDFPTSAEVMLRLWQSLKQPEIDGIVAIDIPVVRDLLRVFGPIRVPESAEPITAENLMEELHDVVQYQHSGGEPGGKKNAVVSLAVELFDRLTRLTESQFAATLESLGRSARERHIQTYFVDPAAQAANVATGFSGAIDPPESTTDLLAVSNAVIKPSKANLGVTKTIDYQVALGADGSAETRLQLGYRKSALKLLGVPRQWLANYVRAHRSPGTVLSSTESGFSSLEDATGFPTFGHYFRLNRDASTSVELRHPGAQRHPAGHHLPPAGRSGCSAGRRSGQLPALPAAGGEAGRPGRHGGTGERQRADRLAGSCCRGPIPGRRGGGGHLGDGWDGDGGDDARAGPAARCGSGQGLSDPVSARPPRSGPRSLPSPVATTPRSAGTTRSLRQAPRRSRHGRAPSPARCATGWRRWRIAGRGPPGPSPGRRRRGRPISCRIVSSTWRLLTSQPAPIR